MLKFRKSKNYFTVHIVDFEYAGKGRTLCGYKYHTKDVFKTDRRNFYYGACKKCARSYNAPMLKEAKRLKRKIIQTYKQKFIDNI